MQVIIGKVGLMFDSLPLLTSFNNEWCPYRQVMNLFSWCHYEFIDLNIFQFSSVQSFSRIWLFETLWIAARRASLSITNSRSLPKLMSIKLVMPSSHLILCRPLSLLPPIPPSIRVFPMSQLITWGGQSIEVSASTSVLPKNTQDWSPLEWSGWISLQSRGLSRVFSNNTVQKHQFFGT